MDERGESGLMYIEKIEDGDKVPISKSKMLIERLLSEERLAITQFHPAHTLQSACTHTGVSFPLFLLPLLFDPSGPFLFKCSPSSPLTASLQLAVRRTSLSPLT